MPNLRGEQMELMDERRKRKVRGKFRNVRYSYGGGYVLPQVGWYFNHELGEVTAVGDGEGGGYSGGDTGGGDGSE